MKWTSLFKKFFSRGRTTLGQQMRQRTWKRIVSGVQPTGALHLMNYLGAIKIRVSLKDNYDTFFFIVDLHMITLPYDVQELSKATRDAATSSLACGIGPSNTSVFAQSQVRAHVELMWMLSSATPIGWLNRMIQFKEKSSKVGDKNVGVALLTFPILMAADILLYQSDFVLVGEDQPQHLELKRELAECGNYLFNLEELQTLQYTIGSSLTDFALKTELQWGEDAIGGAGEEVDSLSCWSPLRVEGKEEIITISTKASGPDSSSPIVSAPISKPAGQTRGSFKAEINSTGGPSEWTTSLSGATGINGLRSLGSFDKKSRGSTFSGDLDIGFS
ncbi:hypothetical protein Nepgr_024871 [Nepenthes gracilis]|uniref:tryptophan--tRNA ligase n=1 Tax=Nepenthes gracilis TaxID=150966 RepID=A0AAD3T3N4_NEPGR|nr:hypothetical protein Nepgr_024871 [Nepenthes gracilis]